MCDSKNRVKMYGKKSSPGRPCVPYCAEVYEPVTMEMNELFDSKRR